MARTPCQHADCIFGYKKEFRQRHHVVKLKKRARLTGTWLAVDSRDYRVSHVTDVWLTWLMCHSRDYRVSHVTDDTNHSGDRGASHGTQMAVSKVPCLFDQTLCGLSLPLYHVSGCELLTGTRRHRPRGALTKLLVKSRIRDGVGLRSTLAIMAWEPHVQRLHRGR